MTIHKIHNLAQLSRGLIPLALLAAIAYFYYGAFYNYSFNLSDEGSVALTSEKLYKGDRPFVDFAIGYGLLWYYPIVVLFKLFGIKFYLIRIYFIVLAFASSLFTYALLLRLTQKHLVALSVALLVLIFPGLMYMTYIPLLVISGAYVLFLYDVNTLKSWVNPWLALFLNGIYLSFAFLIRGDIATIYTLLFLLYHTLFVLQACIREGGPKKLLIVPARFLGIAIIVFISTLPFALHAKSNGYYDGFLSQYSKYIEYLVSKMHDRYFLHPQTNALPADETFQTVALNDIGAFQTVALSDVGTLQTLASAELATLQTDDFPAGTLLQKPGISSFFFAEGPHALIFVTYFPIFIFASIWLYLGLGFFSQCFSSRKLADFIGERTHLLILSLCAFSTFPQFFVWRPDMPHFSEFMPGFMILLAYYLFILGQRKTVTIGTITIPRPAFYFLCLVSAIFLMAFVSVYEEGLIIRKNRDTRLQMEKGIDVRLTKDEYDGITRLVALVKENSKPDEFVLCFPYCPGINFIADRPTFQHSFYVDDSVLNTDPSWLEKMRQDIAINKPKVIVISDWAINGTEISRFKNWAKPLYNEITQNYRLLDKIMGYEIFLLR
ncbi:MAG: hypothetical protein NTX45_29340 [Proteobacteria bacterium]|nr:hypothetical protein [Pseudomonadota bacterium]